MKKIKQSRVIAFSILTLILSIFLTLAFIPALKQVDKSTRVYESLYFDNLNFKVTVILIALFAALSLVFLVKELIMYLKHKADYNQKEAALHLGVMSALVVLNVAIVLVILVGFAQVHPYLFNDVLNETLKYEEYNKEKYLALRSLIESSNEGFKHKLLVAAYLQIIVFVAYVVYKVVVKQLAKKQSKEVLA
ncbi:hypothetical protein [Mycoplasmopsis columboralis]|uniref:Uncharacterized protein n=1 Tax=Mycoplasmopsis columboralis TaxID=171282 RepID=A0A449B5Y6_9BACT|nr:hypothetical protein [Mycoplasmopsis columboralis]VEU75979.1 Uncharacterised protein [Mycoplasmopsis columboralis]